jgi:hypothetical protein
MIVFDSRPYYALRCDQFWVARCCLVCRLTGVLTTVLTTVSWLCVCSSRVRWRTMSARRRSSTRRCRQCPLTRSSRRCRCRPCTVGSETRASTTPFARRPSATVRAVCCLPHRCTVLMYRPCVPLARGIVHRCIACRCVRCSVVRAIPPQHTVDAALGAVANVARHAGVAVDDADDGRRASAAHRTAGSWCVCVCSSSSSSSSSFLSSKSVSLHPSGALAARRRGVVAVYSLQCYMP